MKPRTRFAADEHGQVGALDGASLSHPRWACARACLDRFAPLVEVIALFIASGDMPHARYLERELRGEPRARN
jgi:hypothetical protein